MYREVEGDLLMMFDNNRFNFIAHGCNCFHTMGSGIARQIREKYYNAYKVDTQTKYGDIDKLGNYSIYHEDRGYILNCYTQFNYGTDKCHLDYEALTLCLRKINHKFKGSNIGLPQIGCGLAGGDWERVKKIIQTELIHMDVTVVIYEK